MSEILNRIDHFSGGNFSKTAVCGYYGNQLLENNNPFANKGMSRGSEVHKILEMVSKDPDIAGKYIDHLSSYIGVDNATEILSFLMSNEPHNMISEYRIDTIAKSANKELRCTGYIDLYLPEKSLVIDYKTGYFTPSHIYQILYYAWAVKAKSAALRYIDHPEQDITIDDIYSYKSEYVSEPVTDDYIITLWEHAKNNPEPIPSEECKHCHIKSKCPAYIESVNIPIKINRVNKLDNEINRITNELVELRKEHIDDIERHLYDLKEQYTQPLETKLKRLTTILDITKKAAVKSAVPLKYKIGNKIIYVIDKVIKSIPDNFTEQYPVSEYPQFYTSPQISTKAVSKDLLVEKRAPYITIKTIE